MSILKNILAQAESGTQNSSPFDFQRKWIVSTSDSVMKQHQYDSARLINLHEELRQEKDRVKNIEQFLATLAMAANRAGGQEEAPSTSKGKGKTLKKTQTDKTEEVGFLNGLKKLSNYFGTVASRDMDTESTSGSVHSSRRSTRSVNVTDIDENAPLASCYRDGGPDPPAPGPGPPGPPPSPHPKPGPTEKWIYCEKLQLQYNSTDLGMFVLYSIFTLCYKSKLIFCVQFLDQFSSSCSLNNCMVDYVRTNCTNQFYGTLFSNAINYERYCNGYYLSGECFILAEVPIFTIYYDFNLYYLL